MVLGGNAGVSELETFALHIAGGYRPRRTNAVLYRANDEDLVASGSMG